ncbi:MAG: hypothetical protein ACI97A_000461 [Planctomycetota bacterium]|jgi:hypothetical protein
MFPSPEFETEVDLDAAIAVIRTPGRFAVRATNLIQPGARILCINGCSFDAPTRYSVQVGPKEHIDAGIETEIEESLDSYPWRCLNHSCTPNAVIRNRQLLAVCSIEPWEEVSFDYNTSEYELATPFECECGAEDCCGLIRGFRYLSAEERVARLPLLPSYLRA